MSQSPKQTDIEASIAEKNDLDLARNFFPEGSKVYCVIRSVSRSNMSRVIGLVTIRPAHDGNDDRRLEIRHPNVIAARVLKRKTNEHRDGIKIGGCGMDMGLALVCELARKLYGSELALKHEWL